MTRADGGGHRQGKETGHAREEKLAGGAVYSLYARVKAVNPDQNQAQNDDVVPTPSCCLTASTSPSTQISVIWRPSVVKNAAPIHSISLPVGGIPKNGPR